MKKQRLAGIFFLSAWLIFSPFSFSIKKNLVPASVESADTFSLDKKMQIFSELDAQSNQLWHSKKIRTVKKGFTTTFPSLPLLLLDDRNNDGQADEFSYIMDEKKSNSPEFGFFYDLNKDGKPDYLVYNGGPLFTSDFSRMFWMNYHLIDANGDGAIDIFVYNGVNLSNQNFYDEGITAWVYDKNFDGVFEEAEYIGKDFRQQIQKKDRKFIIRSAMGETGFDERENLELWSHVIEDIYMLQNKK